MTINDATGSASEAATLDRAAAVAPTISRIQARLAEAMQPATLADIATQVRLLTVSFPNAAKADLAIFGALLSEDVASQHPSRAALETACVRLRRSEKFLPCIATMLEALAAAEKELESSAFQLRKFQEKLANATAEHRKALARRERDQQRDAM
jgi:hypothetical protein